MALALSAVFLAGGLAPAVRADAPVSFLAVPPPTLGQTLDALTRIGESTDSSQSALNALRSDPRAGLTLPLTLTNGGSGVSFLYSAPSTASLLDGSASLPKAPPTYGFGNQFLLGGGLKLSGLVYMAGANPQQGHPHGSQALSQALDFTRGAWTLHAHYASVGKDFDQFSALQTAAPSLGLLSDMTSQRLSMLSSNVGKTQIGFSAAMNTPRQRFGADMEQVADEPGKRRTLHQMLSFGQTFMGGLQYDLSHTSDTAHPTDGTTNTALTTTVNHLRFGFDQGKGVSFASEMTDMSDSEGHSDHARLMRFAWQGNKMLGIDAMLSQDSNSQWAKTAQEWQANLKSAPMRRLSITASLNHKTDGATGNTQDDRTMQALFDMPRAFGLSNARWIVTFDQRMAPQQTDSATRALAFDADARANHVHLEYTSDAVRIGGISNHRSARAVRIVRGASRAWLQYSVYYKQRQQSLDQPLPDIRDYQAQLHVKAATFQYHYINQREDSPDCVTDLVQTDYSCTAPLTKTLSWSVAYDQSNIASGLQGQHSVQVGVKGALPNAQTLEAAYGAPEMRADNAIVHGKMVLLNYHAQDNDGNSVALDSQVTAWNKKTAQTPHPVDATIRFNLKKTY